MFNLFKFKKSKKRPAPYVVFPDAEIVSEDTKTFVVKFDRITYIPTKEGRKIVYEQLSETGSIMTFKKGRCPNVDGSYTYQIPHNWANQVRAMSYNPI